MATKQFKAESKRLLDLMIHSIYTHKEIFLRELISNASDAIDKLYFRSLTDDGVKLTRDDFRIDLKIDADKRLITLSDNGCGMTKEELESNLGVIAKSGSLAFKSENEAAKNDVDIIGQFGVGFYSAFMIASNVKVISRAYGSDEAYKWESNGTAGYTIEPAEKDTFGTDIYLTVKENTEEENYDEFLEGNRLASIVRKYSDYIRYPIHMDMERTRAKEKPADAPEDAKTEYETVLEDTVLNSMTPLWKKDKKDITPEEYAKFYQEKFYDFTEPAHVIHYKTEGLSSYNALLFIPKKPAYDYYTREYEKGLQLFSNGVLIMDKCADLLPDHFSFVRGLVDSQDLSLNISREMLQHDRQLRMIAASIEKKIKSELLKMQKDEREKYDEFFKNFGLQLKVGAYTGFGANKELLRELLMFYSAQEKKLITLSEYVANMKEGQDVIYFASGESYERIDRLPQTELVRERGFDILYLVDDVDEFVIRMLDEHEGKKFKSVSADNLDLTSEEEKKAAEEKTAANRDLFDFMKESLGGKVAGVRLSSRLKNHPVCLASEGGVSIEMEKVLNAMPTQEKISAQKILEINGSHPVFDTLQTLYAADKDKLKKYASILYAQALLIEGLPLEDPAAFSNDICELMTDAK